MATPMLLKIAVIDSGINPNHFHVGPVAGGHGYRINEKGKIETQADFSDEIGHGTAIAGILKEKAPSADLYAVKIFQKELSASVQVLMAGLQWAIEADMNLIHLSLGTEAKRYEKKINTLCRSAHDRGLVVLAAARSRKDSILPAALETVIGVFWDDECSRDVIHYYPGEAIEFGAYGRPRELPGLPQERNFRGHSFAVAHVTGRLAQIAQKHPGAPPDFLKEMLCQSAIQKPVGF